MFDKQKLLEYNQTTWSNLPKKYEFIHMGFFNGNDILIVGQNPGWPYNNEIRAKVEEIESEINFEVKERRYQELLQNTIITKFINDLVGTDWNNISFTNYVKCPTRNNEPPTQYMFELFKPVLDGQIEILKPKKVILLGTKVAEQFNMKHFENKLINGISYYASRHPSFLLRSDTSVYDSYVKSLKEYAQI